MLQDNLRSLRHLYYKAPQLAKIIVGAGYRQLPDKLLFGKHYSDFIRLLDESANWTAQEYEDYQYLQLKSTLETAYYCTEYYKAKFDEFGVTPDDLHYLDDITKFPTLSKMDIKFNLPRLINYKIPKWQWLKTNTGGSTADPLLFFQEKGVTRSKEKAFIAEGWRRLGYRYGMKVVQLKGRSVGRPERNRFWEFEPIQNTLEMDSSYLSESNTPYYLEAIEKFRPDYIIGFPSSVTLLVRNLKSLGLHIPQVNGVMLASENLYSWQRKELQAAFGCRVFSHYGHSEMVLLGMESPDNDDLLFFPHYGLLEVLDENGTRKTLPGENGELVGTSFHNNVMPLVRYKTQDLGTVGYPNAQFPAHGVLQHVEGRLQEFIITKSHRKISVATMGAAHFNVLDNVLEMQYFQQLPGKLVLRIVPGKGFKETDRSMIRHSVQNKTGPDLDVEVETVATIARTGTGKHKMLVQMIDDLDMYSDKTSL